MFFKNIAASPSILLRVKLWRIKGGNLGKHLRLEKYLMAHQILLASS